MAACNWGYKYYTRQTILHYRCCLAHRTWWSSRLDLVWTTPKNQQRECEVMVPLRRTLAKQVLSSKPCGAKYKMPSGQRRDPSGNVKIFTGILWTATSDWTFGREQLVGLLGGNPNYTASPSRGLLTKGWPAIWHRVCIWLDWRLLWMISTWLHAKYMQYMQYVLQHKQYMLEYM